MSGHEIVAIALIVIVAACMVAAVVNYLVSLRK